MVRRVVVVLGLGLLCVSLSVAQEKKEASKKPVGTWSKAAGEAKITFDIKADGLKILLHQGGELRVEIEADYAVGKDGYLFGRINKVTKSGNDGPSEGDLFAFRFKAEKDKLSLSDLKTSAGTSDEARQLVEGDYEKSK